MTGSLTDELPNICADILNRLLLNLNKFGYLAFGAALILRLKRNEIGQFYSP